MSAYTLGTFNATPEIIEAVVGVVQSGRLSYGEISRDFEQRFAKIHNTTYGVLSNSGTSSLVVALQAMKEIYHWRDGDEIICPALTFVATVNAILQVGLKPVLVDVDPVYYDITTSAAEVVIGPKTRAIMAVNLFGQACDLKALRKLCDRFALKLIEDSCEALLVDEIGQHSEVAVFSFYMAHLLTAGVGGIAITNNDVLGKTMRSLVNHGISMRELPTGEHYDPSFLGRNFNFVRIGHSFRITEMEAAIALEQLKTIWVDIGTRQHVATFLREHLQSNHMDEYFQLPVARPNMMGSWMVFPMVAKHTSKHDVISYLRAHDVECRDMVPLTNQPCYHHLFRESDYPVSERINRYGFYIGCHQDIRIEDMERVINLFGEFVKEHVT